jgi:hypothetical protein
MVQLGGIHIKPAKLAYVCAHNTSWKVMHHLNQRGQDLRRPLQASTAQHQSPVLSYLAVQQLSSLHVGLQSTQQADIQA